MTDSIFGLASATDQQQSAALLALIFASFSGYMILHNSWRGFSQATIAAIVLGSSLCGFSVPYVFSAFGVITYDTTTNQVDKIVIDQGKEIEILRLKVENLELRNMVRSKEDANSLSK